MSRDIKFKEFREELISGRFNTMKTCSCMNPHELKDMMFEQAYDYLMTKTGGYVFIEMKRFNQKIEHQSSIEKVIYERPVYRCKNCGEKLEGKRRKVTSDIEWLDNE